mgnify:FL=1
MMIGECLFDLFRYCYILRYGKGKKISKPFRLIKREFLDHLYYYIKQNFVGETSI